MKKMQEKQKYFLALMHRPGDYSFIDISILDIANSIGFSNQGRFAKVFYDYFKCKPLEYRRNTKYIVIHWTLKIFSDLWYDIIKSEKKIALWKLNNINSDIDKKYKNWEEYNNMFGPIYDVETNQIIIYEGDYEKLLEKGVKEKYITESDKNAETIGTNLKYQALRKKAKAEGGSEAVKKLNEEYRIKTLANSPLAKMGHVISWKKGYNASKNTYIVAF